MRAPPPGWIQGVMRAPPPGWIQGQGREGSLASQRQTTWEAPEGPISNFAGNQMNNWKI